MADKKISELDAITGANTAATDAFVVVDTSTGQTKKITREELNNAIEQDVLSSIDIDTINGDFSVNGNINLGDNNKTIFGAGSDLQIYHDGFHARLRETTGDFRIQTTSSGVNALVAKQNAEVEITHAGSTKLATTSTGVDVTGALTVSGDFTVNGTTTTINSTTLEVDDKNIVLASGAADAAAANGSGITIDGASATFTYVSSGDKWQLNKPLDVTGNITVSGTVDGRDVAADGTKLDGIEAGATADQTKSDIDALGIDAATLDGIDSTSFLRSDTGDSVSSYTNQIQFPSNTSIDTASSNQASLEVRQPTAGEDAFMQFHVSGDYALYFGLDGSTNDLAVGGWSKGANKYKVWHGGNDGSGSGLDADTVDGIQASSFLRSDTSDTMSGDLNVGSGTDISMSSTADGQLILDGNGYSGAIALNANGMHIYNNSSVRYISFGINETEEMRLETDGDLHVDGNVVAYSTTISDIRLKKDIAPIKDAMTKVQQLNGCTFTYLKDDRQSAGLIAQDLEKVLPSAVIEDEAVFHGEEGETYKTVQYDQVIGLLVEAVKELKAEIEELKNGTAK